MATAPSVTTGTGPGTSKGEDKMDETLPQGDVSTSDHSIAQKSARETSPTAQRLDDGQKTARSKVPDPAAPADKQESTVNKGKKGDVGAQVETGAMVFISDDGQSWEPVACGVHRSIAAYEIKPVGFQPDCALCQDQVSVTLEHAARYGTV